MLLVTGAAGKTGRAVLRALSRRGAPTRAFVRSSEQARALDSLEISEVVLSEIVIGDLTDRRALANAAAGCAAIYFICPNMHPEELAIANLMIDAAHASDCRRLVYHSVLHPQTEAMPHHWQKLRVEARLFESGLETTILQPCAYMQNVLAARCEIETKGCYRIPYSAESRFSWVDLEDVAEAAAMVLTEPGHEGAIYELSGPQRLSSREVAQHLALGIGRAVQAQVIPLTDWQHDARQRGLPAATLTNLSKMFEYYDRYGLAGNSRTLAALLSRQPTDFRTFVERELDSPEPSMP